MTALFPAPPEDLAANRRGKAAPAQLRRARRAARLGMGLSAVMLAGLLPFLVAPLLIRMATPPGAVWPGLVLVLWGAGALIVAWHALALRRDCRSGRVCACRGAIRLRARLDSRYCRLVVDGRRFRIEGRHARALRPHAGARATVHYLPHSRWLVAVELD